MAYAHSWGGATTNTSFTGYPSSAGIYRDSTPLPTGRLAANGGRPIRVYSPVARYAAGAGGIACYIESLPGDLGSGYASTSGGGFRFRIDYSSGTLSFERCSTDGGSIVDDGDGSSWVGSLPGSLSWEQAPVAPTGLSATPGVAQAALAWIAPSDTGQSAITGYLIEWSTDNFATVAGSKGVGNVTSDTVTGLTNGTTYKFRVGAKNAVTTAASTTGVPSATATAFIASVPGAPTALILSALAGGVGASWTAPGSDGGAPILDYLLEWATNVGFTTGTGSVVVSGLSKTVVGLLPGTTYYFRVKARNSVGLSAASTAVSTTTPVRDTLDIVEFAALQVSPGVHVSLRSDAANAAAISLGFSALADGSGWTSIAVVTGFATPGGPRNLDLVADPSGNLYVIGNDATDPSKVLVKRYVRTGSTNVWTLSGTLSGALPSTGNQLVAFAGAYVPATGVVSPKATIFLLARRAGTVAAGSLSYATIDLAAVAASSGSLFVEYGSDPSFLASPTSGEAANSAAFDVALLTGSRVVGRANGLFVVDVTNGAVASVSKAADGASGAATKVRVVPIDSSSFAILTALGAGALTVAFYGTNGALLGSASYAGANVRGGAFTSQWDAFFQRVTATVRVYYVADDSDRKLEYVDVSPSTYLVSAAVVESSTLGAASSTNPKIRVPHRSVDERRVLVEAANALSGVQSVAVYSTTAGNVVPAAPALDVKAAYDASTASLFSWTFGDSNPGDSQTAYELQIQRVSDSVDIVATGKVASTTASRNVAGGTLTNAVPYRWRVRTWDVLDQVGAWSSYSTFTPSSLGTLTITAPAPDNVGGIDTSSYAVVWTYAQVNGYTQTKRRVKVVKTSDSSVLSDTTLQASIVQTYTVVGMVSDTEYRIELTIENSNGQSVSVNRLITPSFATPMTPTVTFDEGENYLDIIVANPEPVGSRPDTVLNYIYRRETGETTFVRVGSTPKNGTFRDRAVRSAGSYDYRVEAST